MSPRSFARLDPRSVLILLDVLFRSQYRISKGLHVKDIAAQNKIDPKKLGMPSVYSAILPELT